MMAKIVRHDSIMINSDELTLVEIVEEGEERGQLVLINSRHEAGASSCLIPREKEKK